jgi:hypothetical protein
MGAIVGSRGYETMVRCGPLRASVPYMLIVEGTQLPSKLLSGTLLQLLRAIVVLLAWASCPRSRDSAVGVARSEGAVC